MKQTPAARPSAPSVRLTTLITATIPSIVSGCARSPRSTGSMNGSVKLSTTTPFITGTAAPRN